MNTKESKYKEKLLEYLETQGWHEDRLEEIKSKEYYHYNYPMEIDKLYRQFVNLNIWNYFEDDGKPTNYLPCLIQFDEVGIQFTKEEFEDGYEYFFSQLLNRNLYYIGRCSHDSICIDEDFNFYTVSEWGIELWGESFYQGLYNYMFNDIKNPEYIRYSIDYTGDDINEYKKDTKGMPLWYNFSDKERKLFSVDLII